MTRMLATAFPAVLALALCQCGAPEPSLRRVLEIEPGDRVRIVHADPHDNLTIGLQNAALGSRESVYSRGGTPSLKIVDDEELQVLLDVLAEQGFFEHARESERPGAKAVLAVDHNGRTWVWSRLPLGQDDARTIQDFYRCVAYVQTVYNRTTAYYTGEGMTAEDFEREKEAVEGQSAKVLRNLQTRKNPPQ